MQIRVNYSIDSYVLAEVELNITTKVLNVRYMVTVKRLEESITK